ncbi:MAG: hypothetical protein HC800_09735 [Phormidesmis sp. RL_2_1]|nr:hypothetical protein [Phormidesmis sp. RL_2_1]
MTEPFFLSHLSDADTASHLAGCQYCLDNMPGAIAQVLTTVTGQTIAYPYVGAGCYKLLEISTPKDTDKAATPPCLFNAIHWEDRDHFELALGRAAKVPIDGSGKVASYSPMAKLNGLH